MSQLWTLIFASRSNKDGKQMLLIRLGTPALLLAVLAACGSSGEITPEAAVERSSGPAPVAESTQPAVAVDGGVDFLPTLNPCELVTPAELESFFGEPASTDAAPESIGPYRSCMFSNQSGGKVIILQFTHETPAQFKADNESSAEVFGTVPTPVLGLGDESVFMTGLLRVRVSGLVTQVVTWHPEEEQDQALAMSQEIARIALTRLP